MTEPYRAAPENAARPSPEQGGAVPLGETKRRAPSINARGEFAGYASVFNRMDHGRDIVRPGAFERSIREKGAAGIKLLWQHDPAEPIGVIEALAEDGHGLYVRGRLLLDLERGREAMALIEAGIVDGLSIGFRAEAFTLDERSGARTLTLIDLWEVSLVTFPMQEAARIDRRARKDASLAELLQSVRRVRRILAT